MGCAATAPPPPSPSVTHHSTQAYEFQTYTLLRCEVLQAEAVALLRVRSAEAMERRALLHEALERVGGRAGARWLGASIVAGVVMMALAQLGVVVALAPRTLVDGSPAPPFLANTHTPLEYDISGYEIYW